MGEQKNVRVGALWVKDSTNGKFFSGSLEIPQDVLDEAEIDDKGRVRVPVVVFKVKEKRNAKGPDWDILLGRDASERRASGGSRQRSAPQREEPQAPPLTDDDIPF